MNANVQVLASADAMRQAARGKGRARGTPKGRQADATALATVRRWIGEPGPEGWRPDLLIEWLHRLQDAEGALREGHLVALAQIVNLPMAQLYETATFYHHFDVVRDDAVVPAVTVRVCDGLSCRLAGAPAVLEQARQALQPQGVRVLPAPCMGRCEQAPAALVWRHGAGDPDLAVQRAVAPASPAALVAHLADPSAASVPSLSVGAPPDLQAYRAAGGYALPAALASGAVAPEAVIQALDDAGLRGLGGAGFPAGRKWRIVRGQPGTRLMAINIDEGEPGTFKDRHWLERDPHRFLEGILVAAAVVGTDACYLYLRDEYPELRALLQQALAELRAAPPVALPHIELRRGAGAYICGEESAMIESIEGRRGEPRMRPPYIAQVGLFGRPTLEHNAETLYWVRDIVERGAAWYAGAGRHGRSGWRSFSLSGRVRKPGVKWAPAGITLRELVDEHGGGMAEGHTLYAYLPGGASGGILPARLADVPLDFDTLQPHGCFIGSAAVIVLSQADR
ncbi:MAG: NAD(P)H-dependent oxidoreductase subunit E, partial [Aquabacterium sp.]